MSDASWLNKFIGKVYVDGLMQKRRNSSANTLELRLSCINPSMCVQEISVYNPVPL